MSIPNARAEASLWIIRLHGPQRSQALEAGFQDWLNSHPENRREFERVNQVWDAVGGLKSGSIPRMARWERPSRARPLASAAVLLLAIGITAWGGWQLIQSSDPSYATAIGEQRTVMLDDGSRVSLNSSSRIAVTYNERERLVRLENGEAYFEVVRDAARPFAVVAGTQRVNALGTAFVVRYEANRVAVALIEGKVSVGAGTADTTTLLPGERVVVTPNKQQLRDKPRMEAVTAWRRGEVIMDRTRLADAVAEMNRHDKTVLIIEDPTLADLRVSGVYKTGDSESFAQAAATMLGLEMTEEAGRIHLRGKADE